jgi:2-methylcitrate dehydratase
MSDQQLSEKFFRLVTPVLGRERAEELHRTAWRVDELEDLHQITSFFSF